MALYYDLPVFRDVYQLILKIFECTKDFPREYKYIRCAGVHTPALFLCGFVIRHASKLIDHFWLFEPQSIAALPAHCRMGFVLADL